MLVYAFSVCPSCSPGTVYQLPTSILIPKSMPREYVESEVPQSISLSNNLLPPVGETLKATLDGDTGMESLVGGKLVFSVLLESEQAATVPSV